MTVDLAKLPAVGQTFNVGAVTLRYDGAKDSLHQGKLHDFTEIGRKGQPKKSWYITTDAQRGFLTRIRI